MVKYIFTVLLAIMSILPLHSQSNKFGFTDVLVKSGDVMTAFAVPYNESNLNNLNKNKFVIKYATRNWIFISCTPNQISELHQKGEVSDFYFEPSFPVALGDTARGHMNINPVHTGANLDMPYSGKGVIIGYVDQGLDFNHPDFKNEDGSSRVLRYWDQTLNSGGPVGPFGYGIVWNNEEINNGSCISTENSTGHGTTVAGMGSGNGRANGLNKGMAPESNIIVVESNFGLPNWTMTIADACEYIFKVADTLGMPAVVNLSLGTYLGSHDGNDPASEAMEALLDEKPGRIIVCAAGNSGSQGKYHVTGNVGTDTSFVWLLNNPSGSAAFGANKIYFDLWSDVSDATFEFAFGADRPAPNYGLRGSTEFSLAQEEMGTLLFDTIFNSNGQRIATMEIFKEIIGSNYRMQVLFTNIDSTSYYYRFMTKGSGKYDMWSGAWLGLNNFVTTIPTPAVFPEIVNYNMPDSLQTIVSSWNCSEKVISVGNFRNRLGHTTKNFNYVGLSDNQPVGKLSPNSSKGPNRHLVVKPDICAPGDLSLTAAPLWMLNSSAWNGTVDVTGWHARNGGTSMASPVIAGIAALYLEKCPKATYATFKSDLINSAAPDVWTGIVPNYGYGYGKPNAHNLLMGTLFDAEIVGETEKCGEPIPLTVNATTTLGSVEWSDGSTSNPIIVQDGGEFIAYAYDLMGCRTITDTHTVVQLEVLPILPILQSGNVLATLSFSNYQWTLNGVDIPGANEQTLVIEPPYGTYTCYCVSDDGCITETPPFTVTLGINELVNTDNIVYPNPTTDVFYVNAPYTDDVLRIFDAAGKEVEYRKEANNGISIGHLPKGIYHISITTGEEKKWSKIVRL